jgi:hypothetical protein
MRRAKARLLPVIFGCLIGYSAYADNGPLDNGIPEIMPEKPIETVLVVEKKPSLIQKLPATLEGYPVEIVETGVIRATEPR